MITVGHNDGVVVVDVDDVVPYRQNPVSLWNIVASRHFVWHL